MSFSPTTFDFTQPALFKLKFDKIPHVEFFSYGVSIPGITGGEVIQPTPIFDIKLPGDKLVYDPLIINFIVNEDLANFREVVDWMVGLYKPQNTDQYANWIKRNPNLTTNQNKYSDAQLIITSNKMNPILKVTFYDAYPISISPLTYDASITDVAPLSTDLTVNFSYYDITTL